MEREIAIFVKKDAAHLAWLMIIPDVNNASYKKEGLMLHRF
ncbi:MAG TPA: hypothetical protein QF710_01045 [Candidatus Nitrosopelagicus sp.]|nr:hypothetical protein [Candidatus Nitrosopelagicus sp.]